MTENIDNPKWLALQMEILKRDGYECQRCGIPKRPLTVMHRYTVEGRKPFEYPPFALFTVCENCRPTAIEGIRTEQGDYHPEPWEMLLRTILGPSDDDALTVSEGFAHAAQRHSLTHSQLNKAVYEFLQTDAELLEFVRRANARSDEVAPEFMIHSRKGGSSAVD